jgi:hypothetical protein
MVFAVRDPSEDKELGSLPVMVVGGLSARSVPRVRRLLAEGTPSAAEHRRGAPIS